MKNWSRKKLIQAAIVISVFTLFYNLLEGVVSLYFGFESDSIALFGFGLDSFIEMASSVLVLWRFWGESDTAAQHSVEKERKATFFIGVLLILLAILAASGASLQILHQEHPKTTLPGVVISGVSMSFMVFLWRFKLKLAELLNSSTMMKDAMCSWGCVMLSLTVLAGSLIYYFIPQLWWSDSVAAILLSALILKEGWGTVQSARSSGFAGGCGCSH